MLIYSRSDITTHKFQAKACVHCKTLVHLVRTKGVKHGKKSQSKRQESCCLCVN